jgi:hypothetical protein
MRVYRFGKRMQQNEVFDLIQDELFLHRKGG